MAFLRLILAPSVAFALGGCVYRFTNNHIERPEGIRTVAVEAVYDTSREVVPHEVLWEALQNAFAADGHLRLAPQSDADALVRAHLKDVLQTPSGTLTPNGPKDDPRDILKPDSVPTAKLGEYRPLTQAGEYRSTSTIAATIEIEVWSLRTRTLLMKRAYPVTATFNAERALGDGKLNHWLRYQEAADATFKTLSVGVAQQVVKDLLVR